MKEFFEERFNEAVSANPVELLDLTRSYLVELMTEFTESDVAFSLEREDPEMPLSIRFLQATGKSAREKLRDCKKIGDFCLFLSGFFSDFVQRKIPDLDFYIAIGSKAYSNVESSLRSTPSIKEDSFIQMFRELSDKFPELVDLYMDVNERMQRLTNQNIMKIYDKYLLLRSRRYEKILKDAGIYPLPFFPTRN
jgi:hypothetical protein